MKKLGCILRLSGPARLWSQFLRRSLVRYFPETLAAKFGCFDCPIPPDESPAAPGALETGIPTSGSTMKQPDSLRQPLPLAVESVAIET
jgi:hypothetical protein